MLSASLTFAPGSIDGEEMCASIITYSDSLVEFEEVFVVKLVAVSPEESFFSLGNTEASVNLVDSDCM